MAEPSGRGYISAGDLEKYSYCPMSWWLSKKHDVQDTTTRKGIEEHERLGETLWRIDSGERSAKESERLVFWYAVVASLIAIMGLELMPFEESVSFGEILGAVALIWVLAAAFFLYKASRSTVESKILDYEKLILTFAIVAAIVAVNAIVFLQEDPVLAQVLEIMAIIWLMAATFFLRRSLSATSIAESLRHEFRVKGKIEYIDMDESKVFKSERYGLSGRPDYVIKLADNIIPVEEKRGRTPQGPLFSHTLQVAAYCLLIEETMGKAPPYGLLKYPEREDQVEYNEDLRKLLVDKLAEMRAIVQTGEAHRNHDRPGKCRHCSRKDVCPERLE
ncbi:MAG: CRISPR-associated protein Cas4 [Candidatus Thermoplasmatota archaeon]